MQICTVLVLSGSGPCRPSQSLVFLLGRPPVQETCSSLVPGRTKRRLVLSGAIFCRAEAWQVGPSTGRAPCKHGTRAYFVIHCFPSGECSPILSNGNFNFAIKTERGDDFSEPKTWWKSKRRLSDSPDDQSRGRGAIKNLGKYGSPWLPSHCFNSQLGTPISLLVSHARTASA
jgi:hypothetical protein